MASSAQVLQYFQEQAGHLLEGKVVDARSDICPPWCSALRESNGRDGGQLLGQPWSCYYWVEACAPHLHQRPLSGVAQCQTGGLSCLLSSHELWHHLFRAEICISCQNCSVSLERRTGTAAVLEALALIHLLSLLHHSPLFQHLNE